jgi:pyrimidine 5'-nucleotidase
VDYTTLFFDLDDTLYPGDSGLWQAIIQRMGQYMLERLGFSQDQVPVLRRHYFETYGTTLKGLQIHHQVDANEYLDYVHDLKLDDFIQPDPQLRRLLLSLPQKRYIFTNADAGHAQRVCSFLGLEGCFQGIIDIRATGFICKPEANAFYRALALAGEADPQQCVFLDDSMANLKAARQLGFFTVLVGRQNGSDSIADVCLETLLDMPSRMPYLWEGG